MAGFFKKIFSFGKKEIETVSDETGRPEEPAAGPPEALPEAQAPAGAQGTAAEPEARETQAPEPERSAGEGRGAGDGMAARELVPVPEALEDVPAGEPLLESLSDVVEENLKAAETAEPAETAEVGEAPAEIEEAATETEEAPAETGQAATETEEASAEIEETATETEEAPAEIEQAATETEEGPVDTDEAESARGAAVDRRGEGGEDLPPAAPPAEAGAPEPAEEAAPPEPGPVEETAPAPGAFAVDADRRKQPADVPAAEAPRLSWFQRLRRGLSRTSSQLTGQITGIFTKRKLDEDTLQDLEDVLIQADLGVETAMRITDTLASGRYGRDVDTAEVTAIMAEEIGKVLAPVAKPLELDLSVKPHVILVVGVNGTGKTTTIGKLAAKLTRGGLKVTLAAGDTFRAAAIEQLKIWGERTGATVVASRLGADASGLAYEAYERARANGSDVLIIDTAGRLQNRAELMSELEKIVRVLGKHDPDAPHTVLQTLDATTGQNALNQVEIFRNVAGVNGLVMTKLDGTARGGILVAISAKHKLPVYFIGVGEGIDDLEPFEAGEFASAIAGTPVEA